MQSTTKRHYTWRPDVPDQRDLMYAKKAKRLKLVQPTRVDLRSGLSPVYDQGNLGSCTGNAIAGHVYFNKKYDASRLFIYYNERVMEGTVGQDAGAMIRDGIKSLALFGAPDETLWPYLISKFKTRPNLKAYASGLTRTIKSYHRIVTQDDMLNCLAEGYPFVAGISVYESFETEAVAETGVVPLPKRTEKLLGGHAILVVGYDKNRKTFLCRNSWGAEWGQGGYFTVPFTYLANVNLANDMWTMR